MNYTLIVKNGSFQNKSSAFYFAKALIEKNHEINCVFFYHDATFLVSNNIDLPVDEKQFFLMWQQLAKEHNIPLKICMNAALKRGLQKKILSPEFELSTLGELYTACDSADRVITF